MSGGMDWLRWHHGTVTDPRFQLVARKARASRADVIAVWAYLSERASAFTERGNFGDIDAEAVDCLFDFPIEETRTQNILDALKERRMISNGRISAWDEQQSKRERDDHGAAERKRKQRELDAENKKKSEMSHHVTPCHDEKPDVTPRGEERREEEKLNNSEELFPASDADEPSPSKPVPCQHDAIIEIYHEVLPMCPRIREWTPARQAQLRARWSEDQKRQNLDYWRDFFTYVGQCDFLVGKSRPRNKDSPPFMADLEWLVKHSNFTKIRERKYENRGES